MVAGRTVDFIMFSSPVPATHNALDHAALTYHRPVPAQATALVPRSRTLHSHRVGCYTPKESRRVQSSRVRLTKTRQAHYALLTMAAAAVRTHRKSWVESSPVTRVLLSQESWCRMFYFRESDSSDRAWRLLSWGINGCRKAYSFT